MPVSIKPLGQAALGAGLTTVYTCPSQPPSTVGVIQSFWVANISGSARTFTIRIGSGTLTSANSIIEALSLAANTSLFYSGNGGVVAIMSAGQLLQGLCSNAGDIVVSAYGEEHY